MTEILKQLIEMLSDDVGLYFTRNGLFERYNLNLETYTELQDLAQKEGFLLGDLYPETNGAEIMFTSMKNLGINCIGAIDLEDERPVDEIFDTMLGLKN